MILLCKIMTFRSSEERQELRTQTQTPRHNFFAHHFHPKKSQISRSKSSWSSYDRPSPQAHNSIMSHTDEDWQVVLQRLHNGENVSMVFSKDLDKYDERARAERMYCELDGDQNYGYAVTSWRGGRYVEDEDEDDAVYLQTLHLSHEYGFLSEPIGIVRLCYDIRHYSPVSMLNRCRDLPLQLAKKFIRGGEDWSCDPDDIVLAFINNDKSLRPDQRVTIIKEAIQEYGLSYRSVVYNALKWGCDLQCVPFVAALFELEEFADEYIAVEYEDIHNFSRNMLDVVTSFKSRHDLDWGDEYKEMKEPRTVEEMMVAVVKVFNHVWNHACFQKDDKAKFTPAVKKQIDMRTDKQLMEYFRDDMKAGEDEGDDDSSAYEYPWDKMVESLLGKRRREE